MADHDERSPLLGSNGLEPNQRIDDQEIQRVRSRDSPQYEGLPEVKKNMKWIVPAVAIGIFLSAADLTIVASSYGIIGSDLKALNKTSWISTAYFLTSTSFQALYGKVSDIFGRKPVLLFAYSVFGIGCFCCGLARNIDELIVARAFAGIGGGGMTTIVSILMSDIVPLRERGTWQGILNIVFASGAACGAPLGGILSDSIGWRWAFLGQAPVCLLAFVAVATVLNLPKTESSDWKSKLRRVDFFGAITLICAVFLLLLGLDQGSNVAWTQPISIVSLALSIPLFATFVVIEQEYAAEPFAPGRIIFDRGLIACYLCNFFAFAGLMSVTFYVPLYFQAIDGFTATQAGLVLLPSIASGVSGSLFGGILMQKTGKYYWLTIAGYTLLILGAVPILLFTGLVTKSVPGVIVGLFLAGFGNGIGVTTTLIGLIASASSEDQATATACSYLFRSMGSVLGLSLTASIVQQSLRNHLRSELKDGKGADEIIKKVRQSLEYIQTLDPETRKIVRKCYEMAIKNGFSLILGIICFSLLSSWFIREKKLSKK